MAKIKVTENQMFDEIMNAVKKAQKAADEANTPETTTEPKKRREIPPVFAIARVAMKYFKDGPAAYQTTEGKRNAVDRTIARDKKHRFADAARFWDAVEDEGLLLDRAADLKVYCDAHKLNYVAVKQHLVLEGKGFMKDIVLNGIRGKETLIDKFGLLLYDREKECPSTQSGTEKQEVANA